MAIKVRMRREASVPVIWGVLAVMLLAMGLLILNLWKLQVREQRGFEKIFRKQSIRRIRLPAVRGKIYDTHGKTLADSVPNYCIAIFTEEMRLPRSAIANTLALLHEIWHRVGKKPDITYCDIKRHFMLNPEKPLYAWKKLDAESSRRWKKQFEKWTAPSVSSLVRHRKKIPGLHPTRALIDGAIVIRTAELKNHMTTTAANTLELVYEISERLGIPREVSFQDIKDHIYARRPLPLLAWKNVNTITMAMWADACSTLTGTEICCQPARIYPEGEALAHLIGFTLEAEAAFEGEDGQRVHFDMRGIRGRKGLESTYNNLLEGEPGYRLIQIDVAGFHHQDIQTRPPKPGGDLQLTIDRHIQCFTVEALAVKQNGEDPNRPVRGAAVVLNPNNGDVLAMASSPSFNPDLYMRLKTYRQALLKDTSARIFHRAVFGQYPPGSIFKPLAILGVLREDAGYISAIHHCRNPYYVGKRRMKCSIHTHGGAHGKINVTQALIHSCNVFMFEMAREKGYDPIHSMARDFGLGQYVGLFPDMDAPLEQKNLKYGHLPERAFNMIDLCNMSIGQGAITVSPLQMAMVASAIANSGRLFRPRLVKKWRPRQAAEYEVNPIQVIRLIDIPAEALEVVRESLYHAVAHPEGSAKKVRVDGITISAKTGSAQYRERMEGGVVDRVHTWMISYAPSHFPRYAVAMVVEDGVSGGNTVGPRLSQLYRRIFEYDGTLEKKESR